MEDELTRVENEISEFNVLYASRIGNFAEYPHSGYRESSTKLKLVKDMQERLNGYALTPAQQERYRRIRTEVVNAMALLGSPSEEYRTSVGKLVKCLGRGQFGTVWRIQDESGRVFAYKIYHANDLHDEEKLRRFQHGFKAMQLLDHTHIVRVKALTECPYGILMDCVDGPNLRELGSVISEPADKIRFLITVAETLQHAHMRDVTHRDLKPENIILSYSQEQVRWNPFLTDFDLAWFSTATLMTNEAIGTMQYGAPEQLQKPGSSAARANSVDAYSFAMLVHFVFTQADPCPLAYDQNRVSVNKALDYSGGNMPVAAAEKILHLYDLCAAAKPEHRLSNFRKIIDVLQEVLTLLEKDRGDRILPFGEFCGELRYRFAGLVSETSSTTTDPSVFRTASGRTMITLFPPRMPDRIISIRFLSMLMPAMDGQKVQGMHRMLKNRIDDALREEFPKARQKPGSTPPFETHVSIPVGNLTTEAVAAVRRLVGCVVDCIERT